MTRTITLFAVFYWMALFAAMAIVEAGSDSMSAIDVLSIGAAGQPAADPALLAVALGLGLAVVAVLFLWSFVTVLFERSMDETDGVIRAAFSVATAVLAALMLVHIADMPGGAAAAVTVQVAALMASYAAIQAERGAAPAHQQAGMDDVRAAARQMAQGAARNMLLARFSSRPASDAKENRI